MSAFEVATGAQLWRVDTRGKKDRSTNIGGGLAVDQGTLYAVNGLAELVALDAAKGTERWRTDIGTRGALGADRRGRAAVLHHDRRPAAGLRHAGRPPALDAIRQPTRRPPCWASRRRPTPTVSWSPGSARASSPRCAPTAASWSGPTASRRRPSAAPWPTSRPSAACSAISRRHRVRDQRRAADGRARPARRPAAVGARGRRRGLALGRRRLDLPDHD